MSTTPHHLTEEEGQTWRGWIRASRAITSFLDRALGEEMGLALVDVELLHELLVSEQPQRMCDLGNSVALTRSGATRAVTRLEKLGLVSRSPSPTDRRSVVVQVTDSGRERSAQSEAVVERGIRAVFLDVLDTKDRATLRRTSERITAAVHGTPFCKSQMAEEVAVD